ncbi:MAG TPA: CBS domain-containing protein [Chloroflexota bacterium]
MRVRDVMRRQAAAVEPEATIADAARAMRELDVGALAVRDRGVLLGVVTDRDITVRATAEGYDPEVAQVRDAMTASVLFCLEDDSVEDAAERMAEAGVRRLVVLDRSKELVGLLSLDDLAARVDGCLAGEVMEEVARPDRG